MAHGLTLPGVPRPCAGSACIQVRRCESGASGRSRSASSSSGCGECEAERQRPRRAPRAGRARRCRPSRRRAARTAKPGTGANAGRCSARPSAARELLFVTGSGAVPLTGAAPVGAVERGEVERDEVVEVDPRQVLAPAGDRAADAELEEREHLRQRAAALVEHDAGADAARRARRAPPRRPPRAPTRRRPAARKSSPAGSSSVTRLVAAAPVLADRGGRDQRGRARVGRAQAGDEVARAELARAHAAGAWSRRPSAGRRPRRRGGRRRRGPPAPRRAPARASGRQATASTPSAARAALRVARQHGHLVAARACSAATSRAPMRPVAPVIVTRIRQPRASWSHLGSPLIQPWIARNSVVSPRA